MKFVAISKDEVRRRVKLYFHDAHGTSLSQLKGSTNVRKMYPYSAKSWAELANTFNKFPWMDQLNVLLSPRDMHKYSTIDHLTDAIWSQVQKVVLIAAATHGLGLPAVTRLPMSSKGKSERKKTKAAKPTSRQRRSTSKPRGRRKGSS